MNREELREIVTAAPPGPERQAWLGDRLGQMFGWITEGDQDFLVRWLPQLMQRISEPLRIVEIGTFSGSTARGLIALTGGGQITCVEDFYEFRHHEGKPKKNPMLGSFETGAACFAATLCGPPDLSAYATLIEAPSTGHPSCRCCPPVAPPASAGWTQPIDLLFVDGDHSYDGALSDFRGYAPHVLPGGHVMVDDFHMPDVARACRAYFDPGDWTMVRNPRDVGTSRGPFLPDDGHIAVYERR